MSIARDSFCGLSFPVRPGQGTSLLVLHAETSANFDAAAWLDAVVFNHALRVLHNFRETPKAAKRVLLFMQNPFQRLPPTLGAWDPQTAVTPDELRRLRLVYGGRRPELRSKLAEELADFDRVNRLTYGALMLLRPEEALEEDEPSRLVKLLSLAASLSGTFGASLGPSVVLATESARLCRLVALNPDAALGSLRPDGEDAALLSIRSAHKTTEVRLELAKS